MERNKIIIPKNLKIPGELINKLAVDRLQVSEMKIFLLLVSLTFGADHKEYIEISYLECAEYIQSSRQQTINSFKSLEKRGYIKNFKTPGEFANTPNKWGINKEFVGLK